MTCANRIGDLMKLVPGALAVLFEGGIRTAFVLRYERAIFLVQAFQTIKDQSMNATTNTPSLTFNSAGLFTLALRLVVVWTYFSAFWRRVRLGEQAGSGSRRIYR